MKNLPIELEELINSDWQMGETKRIVHVTREDGSPCSVGKNAALSVVRNSDGWWYKCFRCDFHGTIKENFISSEKVEEALEALKTPKQYESVAKISLPADFNRMYEDTTRGSAPMFAYNWLWKAGVKGQMFEQFVIGWSDTYNRVIIPIYEYALFGVAVTKKLIGWVGRDCRPLTKAERKVDKAAKYLTRKSQEYKRIYFHAPVQSSDTYVIVEDILSAIRIHSACRVNVFALLNATVPIRLLLALRKKKIIIWLDADQIENVLSLVAKGSSLGLDIHHVHTNKDPKGYNDFAITQKIKEVC